MRIAHGRGKVVTRSNYLITLGEWNNVLFPYSVFLRDQEQRHNFFLSLISANEELVFLLLGSQRIRLNGFYIFFLYLVHFYSLVYQDFSIDYDVDRVSWLSFSKYILVLNEFHLVEAKDHLTKGGPCQLTKYRDGSEESHFL